MKVKEIYPFEGNMRLCQHFVVGDDDNKANFTVIQQETGAEYDCPIDLYPCPYTYVVGNEIKDEETTINGEEIAISDEEIAPSDE